MAQRYVTRTRAWLLDERGQVGTKTADLLLFGAVASGQAAVKAEVDRSIIMTLARDGQRRGLGGVPFLSSAKERVSCELGW